MTNTCKKCGKTVIPDPVDAHCPACGSKEGYTVGKSQTFKHKIEDSVLKYEKQIERLKKFQELYKGNVVEERLEQEIKKLKSIIQDLEKLPSKKPDKVVVIKEKAKNMICMWCKNDL